MAIRLSNSQVTRITEAINRCADLEDENERAYNPSIPEHMLIEDLVEDILKITVPSINEESNIRILK